MPIVFKTIPGSIRTPGVYIEIDNQRAVGGLQGFKRRALMIGQRTTAGSYTGNVPVPVNNASEAIAYFGRGSNLHHQVEKFRLNNQYTELFVLPFTDNGAGVNATGTIIVAGTATAAGTINLYIGARRVQVAVASGDASTAIAAAINVAINAADDLAVTSAVSASTATLTALHKGEIGNEITISANFFGEPGGERLPAGVTLTFSAYTLTSGATNPVLTFANVPKDIYDIIILPWTDATSLNTMQAELDARWGYAEPLEGHCIAARRGTQAGLTSFGNGRNHAHTTVFGFFTAIATLAGLNPAYERASVFAAQILNRLESHPARALNRIPTTGLLAKPEHQFTQLERNILLYDGISTETIQRDGTVMIEMTITTYQVNSSNVPDESYLMVSDLFKLSYIRQDLRAFLATQYDGYNVAADNNPANAPFVVRPKDIKAAILGRADLYNRNGIIEDLAQFSKDLVVERNLINPSRIDALVPPNLVNEYLITAINLQFLV